MSDPAYTAAVTKHSLSWLARIERQMRDLLNGADPEWPESIDGGPTREQENAAIILGEIRHVRRALDDGNAADALYSGVLLAEALQRFIGWVQETDQARADELEKTLSASTAGLKRGADANARQAADDFEQLRADYEELVGKGRGVKWACEATAKRASNRGLKKQKGKPFTAASIKYHFVTKPRRKIEQENL